eukprot:TRINITY_DN238_c0_g1_i3.p1 TRINITY_DN238_c0_g1~~TRINITY_DN238_c0_g1_i3.p1  ORF type:complete len:423 (-),score=76.90 TRINITY_DN238_c0_g1_i3:1591-2859(-)
MLLADEIIVSLRNGSYNGVSYRDLTLWQVAIAEGLTAEELRLSVDRGAPGLGVFLHSNIERLVQGVVRSAALRKAPLRGMPGLFVPVERRGGRLRRIGMVSIIDRMLQQMKEKGVRVFYGKKVTGIDRVLTSHAQSTRKLKLSFLDAEALEVNKLVLNIGKPDLNALGLNSEPLKSASERFRRAMERVISSPYAKTYCFWEDAWWITKLNTTVGLVRTADESMFSARYHDGDVVCESEQHTQVMKCRGAMLVSYIAGDTTGGGSAITVRMFNDRPYSPLTNSDAVRVLLKGNMTAHEQMHYDTIHDQLRRTHASTFASFGLDVSTAMANATACVVGDWSFVGVHSERGAGREEGENVFEMYTKPVEGLDISLVNEAWGDAYGWAEGSLRSAERTLLHAFGIAKPTWLDDEFHDAVIRKFNLG